MPMSRAVAGTSSNPTPGLTGEESARVEEESARLVEHAEHGAIAPGDAYRLIEAEGLHLAALLHAAASLRNRYHGRTVTYSRKVFIPLTNLCRDHCGYCTFVKAPGHPDARTMTPDEVLAIARAGRDLGCKEALFSLGEKPEERHALARTHLAELGYPSMTAYLAAMCRLVFDETGLLPHTNCGVLTPDELAELREAVVSMGVMLENVSPRLMEPGQAHYGCEGKAPELRLRTIADASRLGIAFTTGILIGIGETREERVDSLFAIRRLHEEYGNVQEVIIQNFRAKPDTRMHGWADPPLEEMLRAIAVARLILGGRQNVQAPPNLALGDPGSYLSAGINDWGGISPVTRDFINPERAWPVVSELRDRCAADTFLLRERLCLYPEYLARPDFVRERFAGALPDLVDESGLVRWQATRA